MRGGGRRIAAIPTALAVVSELTTPYRARHPAVRFTIISCASKEVLDRIENLEVEAGVTYLDNEPTGHTRSVPLSARMKGIAAKDSVLLITVGWPNKPRSAGMGGLART